MLSRKENHRNERKALTEKELKILEIEKTGR
jgi:hypothetical protein